MWWPGIIYLPTTNVKPSKEQGFQAQTDEEGAKDDREGEENVTLDGTHGVEDQMVTGKSGLVCAQSGWALS
jgi:hypothetical protein